MKRHSILIVVLSLLLVLVCASTSYAIFPGTKYGLNRTVGDGKVQIQLQMGWWNNTTAWYSGFASNNIRIAQTQNLTLSLKLSSAASTSAAPIMYIVTNFNQGPIFSTSPLLPTYTGLWTIRYITWNAGVKPVPIINAAAIPAGTTITPTSIVVDYPIFAIGQLGTPWFRPTSLAPPIYRIPQGTLINLYSKVLTIPFWYVYCMSSVTRAVTVKRVIIPDSSNSAIATLIGSNYAPNLAALTLPDRSSMYVIDWNQVLPGGGILKVLANQYPVLDACPTYSNSRNSNMNYSPVDSFIVLDRNLTLISPEVLFTNVAFIQAQITRGALVPVAPFIYPPIAGSPTVNAPVL